MKNPHSKKYRDNQRKAGMTLLHILIPERDRDKYLEMAEEDRKKYRQELANNN